MTSATPPMLAVRIERFPLRGASTISRGAKTEAVVVVAELDDGTHRGCGECVPYPRYSETPEAALKTLLGLGDALAGGLDRQALQATLPAGAARNALDCAFIDLEAKRAGRRAWELLGRAPPIPCITAY